MESRTSLHVSRVLIITGVLAVGAAARAQTTAPTPSGSHPRLFLTSSVLSALTAKVSDTSSATAQMVSACQDSINNPQNYTSRGGSDSDTWPGTAVKCAFSYLTTQKSQFLTQAIKYWQSALNDDQTMGDNLGCVSGVNTTNWQNWNGYPPVPPAILTITHDTGYPMRWYGPDIALTYDWLYSAPGVSSSLLAQTRTCLTAWMDYYTAKGYHNTEAGSNYNAGFVAGKTFAAIAIGNDGGADGHLWTETLNDVFANLLVGQGLMGSSGVVGMAFGPMVDGDWAEGWQYGPLSVLEYSMATLAVEEQGVAQPDMDAWTNSLAVRNVYGTVPTNDAQWAGGDFDNPVPYQSPSLNQLDAVLAGPSSDQAAGYAASEIMTQMPSLSDVFIYNPFGEIRSVTAQDYRTQSPAPSLWYLARGTRTMYVRSGWDAGAFWGVFQSAPHLEDDHQHFEASNFVFSRGADHLIVDPSPYGEDSTLTSNAVTADSTVVTGDYAPSQTPWSQAELLWARGSTSGVFAARSDFANAFIFSSTPSDIPYAHREWVMLPEGEIVTIDRVQTGASSRNMYVNYHANTGGTLKASGSTAEGTVGSSQVAIHAIYLSGGMPQITQPPTSSCTVPWGQCTTVRFAVDNYGVKVPGPYAVAIHAIDGLGASESPAIVGSINDDNYDPAPKQNGAVIGAAVFRSQKQSYVIASSAMQGASGSSMTYGVPGTSASRHVVFDAPEDSNGESMVAASVSGTRCTLTITAGDGTQGNGYAGHPLMFSVATSASGCTVTQDTDVGDGVVPPGGGVTAHGGSGGITIGGGGSGGGSGGSSGSGSGGSGGGSKESGGGGCSCDLGSGSGSTSVVLLAGLAVLWGLRRRRGPAVASAARRSRRPAGR